MEKKNPYYVWLSEIMLQQTRVSTVIPYFKKFIVRFPNISSLGKAKIDEVLYYWSGLGYYNRAHNLHKTAKKILEKYNGNFPSKFEEIISLPGIGRSTAGSILTFSYEKSFPILDSNIERVLTRYYGINGCIKKQKTKKKLWSIISQLTPKKNTSDFNQGIMDIGAKICIYKKPKCELCPLKKNCYSFIKCCHQLFPYKTKIKKIRKKNYFLILKYKKYIWINKTNNKRTLNGLFVFPKFEYFDSLKTYLIKNNIKIKKVKKLKKFNHVSTNFHFTIIPILIYIKKTSFCRKKKCGIWYNLKKKIKIGLSSATKKTLNQI